MNPRRRNKLVVVTWARVLVTTLAFSLLVPVVGEAATSITLMWDQNADGVTAGYYVHYGIQSGNYSGSVDVGNATSAVINLPDATKTYYFAVQAYSGTGEQSAFSSEVVWTPPVSALPPTLPPTLQNPGSITTVVGSASVMLKLSAADPAGLALTYSASGLPPGLSVAASTGVISGIPTTVGVYNVTAKVTNTAGLSASQLFTWTILAQTSTTSPISGGGGGNGNGGGNNGGGGGNGNGGGNNGGGGGNGNGNGGGNTSPSPISVTDPTAPADPGTLADLTPPTVLITSPTTEPTYRTMDSKIIVTGIASDDVGVVSVTWDNDRGGSGVAFGTSSWATTPIGLKMGDNIVTITASDAAGNVQTVTLTVTRSVDYQNHVN